MRNYDWVPQVGEEVQVIFSDGFVEIAKFISENDNGTCNVKIGRKQRHTVQCGQVYQNCPPYKKVPQEKPEKRVERTYEDDKEYVY